MVGVAEADELLLLVDEEDKEVLLVLVYVLVVLVQVVHLDFHLPEHPGFGQPCLGGCFPSFQGGG